MHKLQKHYTIDIQLYTCMCGWMTCDTCMYLALGIEKLNMSSSPSSSCSPNNPPPLELAGTVDFYIQREKEINVHYTSAVYMHYITYIQN